MGTIFLHIEEQVLTDITTNIKYAENPYIFNIYAELKHINRSITFSKPYKSKKQRTNNIFLMQCAINSSLTLENLEQINHINLYLNTLMLCDIKSIDGKALKKSKIMPTLKHCLQSNYH